MFKFITHEFAKTNLRKSFIGLVCVLSCVSASLPVSVNAQCRASRPGFITNAAINSNGTAFNQTVLVGAEESDAGEFPLFIISLKDQDTNVNNPLWTPSRFYGPTGNQWTAAALGNVFGLALDRSGNIYAASAGSIYSDGIVTGSLSGNHAGAIYKIDTTTGVASSFVNLTQDDEKDATDNTILGPGIGNITTTYRTALSIYASNFEDGKVYRLNSSGAIVDSYDHGTQGRPNASNTAATEKEAIGDLNTTTNDYNGNSNRITLPGRRVWAVEFNNDRLYYSVWWKTGGETVQPTWYANPINVNDENKSNEIWSVGLNADGSFNTASVRREFSMNGINNQGGQDPVSDIAFTPNGRMILTTRGIALNGAINGNFHRGLVVELTGGFPNWVGNSTKFSVGTGDDGAGSVAYDPTGNANGGRLWFSGEALFEGAFNNQQANTFGFQGSNDNGTNQSATSSVLLDSNGSQSQEKGSVGSLEIACGVTTAASVPVGGTVTTASGSSIRNVRIVMTDTETGATRFASSNSFGKFSFSNVAVGKTYVFSVISKRYQFSQGTVIQSVNSSIDNLTFTADSQSTEMSEAKQ